MAKKELNEPKKVPKIRGNSKDEEAAVRQCREWYERDCEAKKFYVDEMKEMWKLYKGDHWSLLGPNGSQLRSAEERQNRPNTVENITFSMIEGIVAEFAQDIEINYFPVSGADDEKAAETMSDLAQFLQYKNRIIRERIKFLRWFFLYGTGIFHVFWDETWKGGRGPYRWSGDIRWIALHPLSFIPDARCKENVNEGNRCHKKVWRTLEYIEQIYPERAHLVQSQMLDEDDLIETQEYDEDGFGNTGWKDEQVPVIETWYIGKPLILGPGEKDKGIGLHIIWWAGEDQGVYLKHSNYVYFEGEEDIQFPFIVVQCYPRENSIWGMGEAYQLKSPQIARNKTAELVLEGHMLHALGQTFFQEKALTPRQRKEIMKYGTMPGIWLPVERLDGFRRESGQNIPGSLLTELQRNERLMETIVGRFDVSQGRTPGSVTAFKAIAELSARAQVRLRTKEQMITSAYEEAGMYIARLIWENYQESRIYRIRNKHGKFEYRNFNAAEFKKVYNLETGQIMPYSKFNPLNMEDKDLDEYLKTIGESIENYEIFYPELDVRAKVTSVQPADRMYHMEIAKELLGMGVIMPEVFFETMKNGRIPDWEELNEELKEKQKAMFQNTSMMPADRRMLNSNISSEPSQDQSDLEKEATDLLNVLPEEVKKYLNEMPEEQALEILTSLLNRSEQ